jgi:hypothetical protein
MHTYDGEHMADVYWFGSYVPLEVATSISMAGRPLAVRPLGWYRLGHLTAQFATHIFKVAMKIVWEGLLYNSIGQRESRHACLFHITIYWK